jgi:hypothetical protein
MRLTRIILIIIYINEVPYSFNIFLNVGVGKGVIDNNIIKRNCEPYGVRMALGNYYSENENSEDMINIMFNTKVANYIINDQGVCLGYLLTVNVNFYHNEQKPTVSETVDLSVIYNGFIPTKPF